MRKKIKEFTETLFENSEEPFYRYCLRNEADYYVHTLGTFQDRSNYSWSYMADRLKPMKESLAERFEYGLALKRFHWVHDGGKYRIYRVIEPKQIHRARLFRRQGDRFLEKGLFEEAKQKYDEAFKLNPNDPQVYFSLARFFNKTGASEKAIRATKEGLKRISDRGFRIGDRTEK
jgi:tetratricopeptide (TPR) repeat protein